MYTRLAASLELSGISAGESNFRTDRDASRFLPESNCRRDDHYLAARYRPPWCVITRSQTVSERKRTDGPVHGAGRMSEKTQARPAGAGRACVEERQMMLT